jgi:hypothetical protein
MAGAAAKARLQALSKQLVEGIPAEAEFEGLPGIRHVADMTPGERVKGKVVIITGMQRANILLYRLTGSPNTMYVHRMQLPPRHRTGNSTPIRQQRRQSDLYLRLRRQPFRNTQAGVELPLP